MPNVLTPSWVRRVEINRDRPASRIHSAVQWLALAALVSIVLEFGFDRPPLPVGLLLTVQIAAVVAYVVSRVYDLARPGDRWGRLRSYRVDGVLLLLAAIYLFFQFESSPRPMLRVWSLCVGLIQVVLLVRLGIEGLRLNLSLSQDTLHPTRFVALTFLSLIAVGTLALSLPKATAEHVHDDPSFTVPRHVLNCAFTATSAMCVTGLVVYDTGSDFTPLGQVVILSLIQAGGLGIMIFGSAMGMLVGQRLSLKQSLVLQDAISHRTLGQLRSLVVFIVVSTLAIEALGAVILHVAANGSGSGGVGWFFCIFHSVSAFCNAGFALQSDSLIPYVRLGWVYGCIMPLIILGGLGFPVLRDVGSMLGRWVWSVLLRRVLRSEGLRIHTRPRLSLHTKMVLVTSVVLVLVPVPLWVLFESVGGGEANGPATMAGASITGRVLDALFLSVTCRTAGFNTVAMDPDSLSVGSHMLACVVMFIGGSPGSTAGGVKTIALAVLLLSVWATLRGRTNVEVLGRTIPEAVVRRAGVVVILMFALVVFVTLTLCLTEAVSLRAALFESVSAAGTVGLSTGLTADLTLVGRIVIMGTMFAGRLGPLTVLIALASDPHPARYRYPTENVTIG